jgi:hypothetical protein
MEQKEARIVGAGHRRSRGASPLPKRWFRAQRWNNSREVGVFDMAALKLMLVAESHGRG